MPREMIILPDWWNIGLYDFTRSMPLEGWIWEFARRAILKQLLGNVPVNANLEPGPTERDKLLANTQVDENLKPCRTETDKAYLEAHPEVEDDIDPLIWVYYRNWAHPSWFDDKGNRKPFPVFIPPAVIPSEGWHVPSTGNASGYRTAERTWSALKSISTEETLI